MTADDASIEARAVALLADILDNPLAVLPGAHPGDCGQGPTELRLAHFRPDLSERIAVLLDEAGA
jgi:hypothetical protein